MVGRTLKDTIEEAVEAEGQIVDEWERRVNFDANRIHSDPDLEIVREYGKITRSAKRDGQC